MPCSLTPRDSSCYPLFTASAENLVAATEVLGEFAAQTVVSGVMVTTATVFAVPVSTTHITTTSIMGVGSTRRLSAVRWGVAGNIVAAWVVTLPAAGGVAAVAYFLTHAVVG